MFDADLIRRVSPWSMDFRTASGDRKDFFVIILEFIHFSLVTMTTVG